MTPNRSETNALVTRLRRFALFAGLDEEALRSMTARFQYERWPQRAQVMPAAKTAEQFYVLLEGRVRIEAQHPSSGRALTLFLLGPGDGHNIITLLDGKPHDVQAETLDAVEAVSAPLMLWREWLVHYPQLQHAAILSAAQRLRELSELAGDLALHETSVRLAHLLLRNLEPGEKGLSRLHGMVHEDIARLIGSVRVVVNRLINRFKREGVIHTSAGLLHVADLERLMQKAEQNIGLQRTHSADTHGDDVR